MKEVQSTVVSVAHCIDHKRWTELRALYADEVETHYTSLFGGAPQRQAADALIETWRTVLGKVITQHLLGPIDVEQSHDRASARCHVRAMHFAPQARSGCEWEVLGHYVFGLRRSEQAFQIVSMRLETFHQLGNRQLFAGDVAAQGTQRRVISQGAVKWPMERSRRRMG